MMRSDRTFSNSKIDYFTVVLVFLALLIVAAILRTVDIRKQLQEIVDVGGAEV
jgi:hypothetical protein